MPDLSRFGFSFERGGAHTSRTMMLVELQILLSCVDRPEAMKDTYARAIIEENCLGKRSAKTRALTFRHLVDLYALDPGVVLFRALRFFWHRESQGQPLLALLCAYSRDTVLRATAPFIRDYPEGSVVSRESLEAYIDNREPGRFSQATLKSTAQNINATWTQSGHLAGRVRKIRCRPVPTSGAVSYALLLGYVAGARGEALFQTEYAKLLECPVERAIELAEDASRRGWIVFKRIGDVIEVLFPSLLNAREMEWLRE